MYVWFEDDGVCEVIDNHREQAIQLLYCGSKKFRTRCGKLLVEALNQEGNRNAALKEILDAADTMDTVGFYRWLGDNKDRLRKLAE